MLIYIYGLYDPRNDELRYIGKSKDPNQRLFDHLSTVKNNEISSKANWLRELISEGYIPLVKILEKTDDINWEEAEKRWIREGREKGLNLLNVADGGNNPPDWLGKKQSPYHVQKRVEARKAKGNYHHSEETRKKISENRKGKATGTDNGFYGKKHPREIMDKIREINKNRPGVNKGRHLSDETKKKISEANKGKTRSAEDREKLSRLFKGRKMSPEFSEKARQRMLGSHLSEEIKEKLRQANLGKHHSHETKQKLSILSKGKHFSDEQKQQVGKTIKEKWEDPEYKAKMKEMRKKVQQEKWNDPEYRAKMLEAQKRRREREALEKANKVS